MSIIGEVFQNVQTKIHILHSQHKLETVQKKIIQKALFFKLESQSHWQQGTPVVPCLFSQDRFRGRKSKVG